MSFKNIQDLKNITIKNSKKYKFCSENMLFLNYIKYTKKNIFKKLKLFEIMSGILNGFMDHMVYNTLIKRRFLFFTQIGHIFWSKCIFITMLPIISAYFTEYSKF